MQIAFGMIIFEGDYVLHQCLQQVYPYATQILIAEGPVKYWQDQGRTKSLDHSINIIKNFPDPYNKICLVQGQFSEKDDQANAYLANIDDDIDYLWNLDSDEVYSDRNLLAIIEFLKSEQPTSVGVRSCSFYGGFDHVLTGYELKEDNFLRIFKVVKGSKWLTHRPPTICYPQNRTPTLKHVTSEQLYIETKAFMHHYSYVFPSQVYKKVNYYKNIISKERCIDDYFKRVYLNWVLGTPVQKKQIEAAFLGVHEFKPEFRGECLPMKFDGEHPEAIAQEMEHLTERFKNELLFYR